MQQSVSATVVEPEGKPTGAVIWLHGLGANSHDFEAIVPQLELDDLSLRYIFPQAPDRPVTINGGMEMPAWYDIVSSDLTQKQDQQGLNESREVVLRWLQRQLDCGIALERIVIAGFSQGGAVALHSGLYTRPQIGGVMALSTYLPLYQQFEETPPLPMPNLPIFMAHGVEDTVIPITIAVRSKERLEKHGFGVNWHHYPMAHSVCNQEIGDISRWLRSIFD